MYRKLRQLLARRPKSSRAIGSTLLLLLVIGTYDYLDQRTLSWHQTIIAKLQLYGEQLVREWNRPDHKPPPPPTGQLLTGRVVKVTDGDTFVLLTPDWHEYNIRLYGIDAPEYDQPHGRVASSVLAGMISDQEVSIMIVDIDNYGRPVGSVQLAGMDINHALVRQGHAWWYRQYAKTESALAEAETRARESNIGLWSADNPVPPWMWRRRR